MIRKDQVIDNHASQCTKQYSMRCHQMELFLQTSIYLTRKLFTRYFLLTIRGETTNTTSFLKVKGTKSLVFAICKNLKYGIENEELMLFRLYLTNRKQVTRVNAGSSPIENKYGVPQESILGALLLIIYINDMEKVLKKCEIVLYADNTLIFTDDKTDNLVNDE